MNATAGRQGLLFALPGTSCPAAAATLERIGLAAARRFPAVEQRWAYTSHGVRRKLAAQGRSVPDPAQALTALRNDGFTHVAVMTLHLADGMEFGELAETVAGFTHGPAAFARIALGTPLLACAGDLRRAFTALLSALPTPGPNEGVLLVAHGSRDPQGRATFGSAAALCRQVDPGQRLGMMLGSPGLDETLQACRAAALKKVWLLPFMVAAGYSAREEIAGPGANSWKSALERKGLECVPVIKGLSEFDGVVDVWLDQIACLLEDLATRG